MIYINGSDDFNQRVDLFENRLWVTEVVLKERFFNCLNPDFNACRAKF